MRKKSIVILLLIVIGLLWQITASAEPNIEKMRASTVMVVCQVSQDMWSTGSGFIVGDGDYIVTNHHVIAGSRPNLVLGAIVDAQDPIKAAIVWSSPQKDLAILKLSKNVGAERAVVFAPADMGKVGDDVWIFGFPGAAQNVVEPTKTKFPQPSFTKGQLSSKEVASKGSGTKVLELNANVRHGNSGGPVFTSQQQVLGIISFGPAGDVADVQGLSYAIQTSELLPELERLKINYKIGTASAAPGSSNPADSGGNAPGASGSGGSKLPVSMLAGVILIAIGGAVWFFNNRSHSATANSGRQAIARTPAPFTVQGTKPAVPRGPSGQPFLQAVAGTFAGQSFSLDAPITLGRDPQRASVLYPPDFTLVSRVHCTIRYEYLPGGGRFVLSESAVQPSKNGTFLMNGMRLIPGNDCVLTSGDKFMVGDKSELFIVQTRSY